MTNITKGLCWAGAILFTALGNYLGYIADDTAQTMFIVLPIVAVMTSRDGAHCLGWPLRREA
jgi:hypothetical protein